MPEESGNVTRGFDDVCDSISDLRAARGLTQKELAELSGISEATIKKFEAHTEDWNPSRSTLAKLSKAFDLEKSHLSDVYHGLKPPIQAARPKAKRKPEDYLEEIVRWMSSVDNRLESMDSTIGKLAARPDIIRPDE